jgi:branched-chain amino acid transport system ATP-binding protein
MSTQPLLKVEHLTMRFGGLVAINDLSFDVHKGDITALIGPNGAGKTTVFNCITGFYKPTEGMMTLTHADGSHYLLERMPDFRIAAQAKVARTFQNIRLFTGMTVLENALVGAHRHFKSSLLDLIFQSSRMRDEEAQWIAEAAGELEFVGIAKYRDTMASTLPYGHQRRLEIARALLAKPELLLLDEPMAGMNSAEKDQLAQIITRVRQRGITILLIEHDMQVIRQLSDRVAVLHHGETLTEGTVKDVFNHSAVKEAYLGRAA